MTKEKKIEILVKDGCTKREAEKALARGSVVFEDFEEAFCDYMNEWDISEEEQERFQEMIKTKRPVEDWGIVEEKGKIYYIMYVN